MKMEFTVVSANAPIGATLVNLQLQAQAAEDGTEGALSLNLPIVRAAEYVPGTVLEVTITPQKS